MRAFSAVKAYGNMTNSRQVCTVQLVRHLSEGSALRGPLGQMCVCVCRTHLRVEPLYDVREAADLPVQPGALQDHGLELRHAAAVRRL